MHRYRWLEAHRSAFLASNTVTPDLQPSPVTPPWQRHQFASVSAVPSPVSLSLDCSILSPCDEHGEPAADAGSVRFVFHRNLSTCAFPEPACPAARHVCEQHS